MSWSVRSGSSDNRKLQTPMTIGKTFALMMSQNRRVRTGGHSMMIYWRMSVPRGKPLRWRKTADMTHHPRPQLMMTQVCGESSRKDSCGSPSPWVMISSTPRISQRVMNMPFPILQFQIMTPKWWRPRYRVLSSHPSACLQVMTTQVQSLI